MQRFGVRGGSPGMAPKPKEVAGASTEAIVTKLTEQLAVIHTDVATKGRADEGQQQLQLPIGS